METGTREQQLLETFAAESSTTHSIRRILWVPGRTFKGLGVVRKPAGLVLYCLCVWGTFNRHLPDTIIDRDVKLKSLKQRSHLSSPSPWDCEAFALEGDLRIVPVWPCIVRVWEWKLSRLHVVTCYKLSRLHDELCQSHGGKGRD